MVFVHLCKTLKSCLPTGKGQSCLGLGFHQILLFCLGAKQRGCNVGPPALETGEADQTHVLLLFLCCYDWDLSRTGSP